MLGRTILAISAAILVVTVAATAGAQSTNAPPVIVEGSAMLDPSSLAIPSDAQQAVKDAEAKLKSGALVGHVMAVSANLKNWGADGGGKADFISTADLARQALETCEYLADGPCMIIEVNGHDARDATGSWPTQPRMLDDEHGKFDQWRVPFVALADRDALSGYATATGPRAMAITPWGDWVWDGGKTIFDAVSSTYADCQKNGGGGPCILYAVNDDVVFSQ